MKKFHITITDNETGETLKEADACAILGAYRGDEYTASIVLSQCRTLDLLSTLRGASAAIDRCLEDEPLLRALYEVTKKLSLEKAEDSTEKSDN